MKKKGNPSVRREKEIVDQVFVRSTGAENLQTNTYNIHKVSIAIPITAHGGLQCCETSRLSHFLDNRLIDGDTFSGIHIC
jgi:hypothetical protein